MAFTFFPHQQSKDLPAYLQCYVEQEALAP